MSEIHIHNMQPCSQYYVCYNRIQKVIFFHVSQEGGGKVSGSFRTFYYID